MHVETLICSVLLKVWSHLRAKMYSAFPNCQFQIGHTICRQFNIAFLFSFLKTRRFKKKAQLHGYVTFLLFMFREIRVRLYNTTCLVANVSLQLSKSNIKSYFFLFPGNCTTLLDIELITKSREKSQAILNAILHV